MTEQLSLTFNELVTARRNFSAKYQPADPELACAWDISVGWADLLHHITTGIHWPLDQTLLRLIHRFDKEGWFLTMECCHVAENGNIDTFGPRFDLHHHSIQPSTGFAGNYDPAYFSHITYEGNSLVAGMHVNYVVLPLWLECKAIADRNIILAGDPVNIVFSSISLDFGHNTAKVNVRWPHTIAFCFSDAEGDLLGNVAYSSSNPLLKANDCAGLCPGNYAHLYAWPSVFGETAVY